MQGHVARKRRRYYAVIYEGLDPITGKEKRSAASDSGGSAPSTSRRSTTRCCIPPTDRRPLAPKPVYEVHLIIRGALGDAVRRGLVTRNVALVANAPKMRSIPRFEQKAWTARSYASSCGLPPVTASSRPRGCQR